jgi:hypothetical protein
MSFTIKRTKNTKSEIVYKIDFAFKKQSATVLIKVDKDDMCRLYLNSETNGYHWFEFLLCQEPKCKKLIYDDGSRDTHSKAREKAKSLFSAFDYQFMPQDKESFFLVTAKKFTERMVNELAKIIEPRFAIRERFFD